MVLYMEPVSFLENGKPNHFQFLDQSPLGETTTTTAHTYYHVLLNESIHSMSNRHLLLRRSFWCPQCIRRGLPPWVAATTAAVVLLLTSLVVYACWLVQTSQHATLLSLFSTIVMWGGVRNDPSCISNGVGCELEEQQQQQDTNAGEGNSNMSECTLNMDAEDSYCEVLLELREKFAAYADGETCRHSFQMAK